MKHIDRYENETIIQANRGNEAYSNALSAYEMAVKWNADRPIMNYTVRPQDARATAIELKEQGFTEFVFTCPASNMFDTLAGF